MTWKICAGLQKPYRKTYPKPIPAEQNAKRLFVLRFVQNEAGYTTKAESVAKRWLRQQGLP
jgi:hypothetical protein